MTVDGMTLYGWKHEAVCDAIRASGDWYEGDVLRAVAARRPRESLIVDVGAHIGNHSVWWLEHVDPSGVVALEPMPETFARLAANLASYPTATALNLAASDVAGDVMLVSEEVNRGRCYVDELGDTRASAIALDELELADVSLIKVDVEGWQGHVLRGATRTLYASHPALLVEDGEDVVAETLDALGLGRYARVERFPGANDLWVWS